MPNASPLSCCKKRGHRSSNLRPLSIQGKRAEGSGGSTDELTAKDGRTTTGFRRHTVQKAPQHKVVDDNPAGLLGEAAQNAIEPLGVPCDDGSCLLEDCGRLVQDESPMFELNAVNRPDSLRHMQYPSCCFSRDSNHQQRTFKYQITPFPICFVCKVRAHVSQFTLTDKNNHNSLIS